jgi:hypothetical protein
MTIGLPQLQLFDVQTTGFSWILCIYLAFAAMSRYAYCGYSGMSVVHRLARRSIVQWRVS